MKSYTTLRNLYGTDTKNTASANLTYGDQVMADFYRRLLARADWPFLHKTRMILSVSPTATVTVNAGTDVVTATDNGVLTDTGTEVTFSTTDTLPAGLSASTVYYLIYQSSTTFKIATSLANALAGTAVDITDTGTGTHTMSIKTRFQALPHDIDLIESVMVRVDDTEYTPKPSPSRNHWDELNTVETTSDFPQWWFVQEGKIAFWPRQSNDGNRIFITGKVRVPDLNIADYTTGTIDVITNGSVAVTGSGTSWTKSMAGRWIRVTHSNTDASSGDGEWYEIASVASSTSLTLVRPYGGRSLTTGAAAAYTIGQMPLLPEAFHDLPEVYGAWRYWLKEKDSERANGFKAMYTEGVAELFTSYGINDLSMVVDDGEENTILNPNLTVML